MYVPRQGRDVRQSGGVDVVPHERGTECAVYNPFLSSMMLAVECQRVIELRLVRIAWGGREGWTEASSMVAEKINAAMEASATLMLGGSPETVIARYREHVAANAERLSAEPVGRV